MKPIYKKMLLALAGMILSSSPVYAYHYNENPDSGVGSSPQITTAVSLYVGSIVAYLPDDSKSMVINETQYFFSGNRWFLPLAGDGISYIVVLPPV